MNLVGVLSFVHRTHTQSCAAGQLGAAAGAVQWRTSGQCDQMLPRNGQFAGTHGVEVVDGGVAVSCSKSLDGPEVLL